MCPQLRSPPQAPLSKLRTLQHANKRECMSYLPKDDHSTRVAVSNETSMAQAL